MAKIPVSVLITTKNEEYNIARCLKVLQDFAQVIVVDSHSDDRTCDIAQEAGAQIQMFEWDGAYPKKRQYCLDNFDISHDWVFWVDADEVVSAELVSEIRVLFNDTLQEAGFFVKGRYVWGGQALKYGLQNNKIALFNRHKMCFPVINDLDIAGMGEIEGHYQPIMIGEGVIGQLSASLLHYAYEDVGGWMERHQRYAHWESEVTRRSVWPRDPMFLREILKKMLRKSILRPYIVFFYSYIVKLGFLDGRAGYDFARSRKKYCSMILEYYKA